VSGIDFARFFLVLGPVALTACVIVIAAVGLLFRRQMRTPLDRVGLAAEPARPEGVPLRGAAIVALLVAGLFASGPLGLDVSLVALLAGALVLIVSPARPGELLRMVDWVLLFFFAGLFVVIGGARQAGVLDIFLERIDLSAGMAGIVSIHLVSVVASQLVSNVPLTLLAVPLLERAGSDLLWLSLAAGATLAGNLTVIGAVANIIVVEGASKEGVAVPWGQFFRVSVVVTALTVAASMALLAAQWQLGWVR